MSVLDPPVADAPLAGPLVLDVPADVRTADDAELVEAVRRMELARRRFDAARLAVLAELDARGEPIRRTGLETGSWLGAEFGLPSPCNGRDLRTARKLRSTLDETAGALAAGRISFEHASLLARLCNPRVEHVVVDLQQRCIELAQGVRFEKWATDVRSLIDQADTDGAPPELRDNALSMSDGLDGELHLDVDLSGDGEASVRAALLDEVERRYRDHRRDRDAGATLDLPGRRQMLAEALVELVRRGSAARPGVPAPVTDVTLVVQASDPLVGFTPDGVRLADGTFRRLACDATFHAVIVDSLGVPLDMGRGFRFATKDQRRAALVRDGGCVHPGCDAPPSWVHLHHVIEWDDDGQSNLVNLASVCPSHHGLWHSNGWSIRSDTDGPGQGFLITTPTGAVLRSQQHGRERPASPVEGEPQTNGQG